ncbi:hypothetical protein UFOVP810_9 [uncultured Caudovirales phage]|uniref:Uncharacterized protein n=1 Tax=uncultured Caudovirales phage TaxID=2100421 RepID=A0A6J5NU58_9CAUD|nr:hypothetical protein UFOVP810_9 [uncultured Caudovirales phage]
MSELPTVYEFSTNVADAKPPQPLPTGEYRATVRGIEPAVSKSSGNQMAVISYFVSPDQYPADYVDGNPEGTTSNFYLSLVDNPRNIWLLKQMCEMHGVVASKRINLTEFMGQDVVVSVSHEDYQGMPQARFRPVRAV